MRGMPYKPCWGELKIQAYLELGKEGIFTLLLPLRLATDTPIATPGPGLKDRVASACNVAMDQGMTRERWLSLGLQEDALVTFEAGGLRTIEAAGNGIVGVPKHGAGHHLLGTASSREEAVVIATILRLFNPN